MYWRRIWTLLLLAACVCMCSHALGEGEAAKSGVLMADSDLFGSGDESRLSLVDTSVLGNEDVSREQISIVYFLDSLEDAPEDAWDVSAARDGSILAWLDPPADSGGLLLVPNDDGAPVLREMRDSASHDLYIAAGGVRANPDSSWLFAYYTDLQEIHFDACFDTREVRNMRGMFAQCQSLGGACPR